VRLLARSLGTRDLSSIAMTFRILSQSSIAALLLAVMVSLAGCRPVPQVVDDPAVYRELDALYTAVTSHRQDLLLACRERLTKLHVEKHLSDAGFTEIADIMSQAEKGEWSPAATRLYDFMRAQRRKS
jgi:hypothetical protein